MPQPKKAPRFGGSPGHHNLLVSNLTTELFRHGRISTTLAKAKTVQPLADRMVTFAKRGDVHARRQVLRVIRDKDVVHKLFADVGPAFVDRNGGYTRVLKTGPRKGDAAPMAIIELVEGVSIMGDPSRPGDLAEEPRRRWSLRRRSGTLSATARDREEDRAAAVDRGEDLKPAVDPESSGDPAEAVPVGTMPKTEQPEPADTGAAEAPDDTDESEDSSGPEADAAEVESRLAAEEESREQAAAAESAAAEEAQAGDTEADGDPRK